ncbi:MAG: excinuclease ABC subunit UvrA [Planctomycetes bacterium]|nr:excinuclease ABC subunit UvrA [Planctomycetota bacterium]
MPPTTSRTKSTALTTDTIQEAKFVPTPSTLDFRSEPHRFIRVRGAREHNLKDISFEMPRDKMIVMTGLSGSGKSSLAFDTIFAEGQRKYMESLSAYARQFLDQLKKPDVDEVEGIPPTIAIEQRSASGNPRSTVATTTEIYDYLRLLFARCGHPYSWAVTKTRKDGTVTERSGTPITATSSTQVVDAVLATPSTGGQQRIMVLAPVVRGKKGFHRDVLEDLSQQGWNRARVNGKLVDLREALKEPGENPLGLGRHEKHTIDAVVDRLAIAHDARQRLAESIEAALRLAEGLVVVSFEQGEGAQATWKDKSFSTKFADPEHPEVALEELAPRTFSFNSPFGACPTCNGLGTLLELDEVLVCPDHQKSLREGAIEAYAKNMNVRAWFTRALKRFCRAYGVDFESPLSSLAKEKLRILMHGASAEEAKAAKYKWEGVIPELTNWWRSTDNPSVKEWLAQFMSSTPCQTCRGDRLRIEALHVLIESTHAVDLKRFASGTVIGRPKYDGTVINISEFSRLTITEAVAYVKGLKLGQEHAIIAEPILKEINNRLRFLAGVGLEYLSLDRKTATLSGGEAQRIRLASQVGSGLVGACYVLDEPTIGLHQRDNDRLIATLRHLTDIGNTVIVVEHDEDVIRNADYVVDVGPGPGIHGGRIVAQGTVEEICANPDSLTGDYLSGRKRIDVPRQRRKVSEKNAIIVKGAEENNLKKVDAAFPLGGMICVTGVSGSGKSTLVNDILLAATRQHLLGQRVKPGKHQSVKWPRMLDRVIEVDQSPIGRTPRSNPATYVGFFDEIRKVFVQTKESKIRGYKPGRFSFNVRAEAGGGRCEVCQGQGLKKIEMHFLPDVYVECEVCRGKRYNRETLEVLYRGKSIADVLSMTIENALEFFANHPKIERFLQCLHEVGLDYVQLGQPSTQLSGGEAQRIKLATELGKGSLAGTSPGGRDSDDSDSDADEPEPKRRAAPAITPTGAYGHTLYVLDEPTTGLHFEDIRKLIGVMNRLADAGNTLVVIEHNLDVIKCADWIIDLGPEGGEGGGRIIAAGTPEQVAKVDKSHTGRYLRRVLG